MLDIYHWETNANSGKPLLAVLVAREPSCALALSAPRRRLVRVEAQGKCDR
jgi:hypothetical protein